MVDQNINLSFQINRSKLIDLLLQGIYASGPVRPRMFMKGLYKKLTKKARKKLAEKAKGKVVIKYRSKNGTKKVSGAEGNITIWW